MGTPSAAGGVWGRGGVGGVEGGCVGEGGEARGRRPLRRPRGVPMCTCNAPDTSFCRVPVVPPPPPPRTHPPPETSASGTPHPPHASPTRLAAPPPPQPLVPPDLLLHVVGVTSSHSVAELKETRKQNERQMDER